jgi:hypothetical protein
VLPRVELRPENPALMASVNELDLRRKHMGQPLGLGHHSLDRVSRLYV